MHYPASPNGMNGLRWVIHPKHPGLLDITAPWFLEVGHVTLYCNQWGPSPMLDRVQDNEYPGQGSVWTAFDLRKSCLRQIEEGKAVYRYPMERCSTPLPIQDGPRYGRRARSVNCLKCLCVVCVDIRALPRPRFPQQFMWMVSTDPIDVWGEYANYLTGWFLEVGHYVDGSRWSQFLVGDVVTTELLCVANQSIWRYLQSASFAAHPLLVLCRRWWGPSKFLFIKMKCFRNVQLTCDYRRSDEWFD